MFMRSWSSFFSGLSIHILFQGRVKGPWLNTEQGESLKLPQDI